MLGLALTVSYLPLLAAEKPHSEGKVAVVNGSVITQADFDLEMGRVQEQFRRLGRSPSGSELSKIRMDVLENLIARELLYQESRKEGIKAEEQDINQQFQVLKGRFSGEAEFENALTRMNLSEAGLRSHIERNMVISRFIEEKFVQEVTVSDKETRAYYDSHQGSFKVPERVKASHILIKVDPQAGKSDKAEARKKLETIQQRLQKGEDFGALAREFSQGPSSSKGGDLGYFSRGQMVKPFEEAAFALQPDQVSEIVETRFGYHLIKVVDKTPETKMAYGEVKDRLGQYLKHGKVQQEIGRYVDQLKEKAQVERFPQEDW